MPRSADLYHALGLLLVRRGEKAAALKALEEAARLAPDNARFQYVAAVALHGADRRREAIAQLRRADQRLPGNIDIVNALVAYSLEAGDRPTALRYARLLAELEPGRPEVARLVADLERP